MKLEAGKTYVFIDDAARGEFISLNENNAMVIARCYYNGFKVAQLDDCGDAEVGTNYIDKKEFYLFKESKPFDISEYEFSDKTVSMDSAGIIEVEYESFQRSSGWLEYRICIYQAKQARR